MSFIRNHLNNLVEQDLVYAVTEGTPIPEPLTILGAGTAIAFGAGFKRKLAKAKKK
ncbi:PEP-CTERM sorting domain-containing protein [Crocosphaera watsonii WH 8501]|uniref:PEP-CTERM sorting domain-containing protein n=1 Tax=Crocosphaera watsonii TaxID=263511 RepID=UPI00399093CA